ncbi:MAG TPA: Sir2 family NAD-dependent protein deacetylase [Acidimicrobiales bacterium]
MEADKSDAPNRLPGAGRVEGIDGIEGGDGFDRELAARVDEARALLARARRVVALTGAGISTDSGIPDFRGPDGVWTRNPEAERMATLHHYLSDPEVRKRAWRNRLDHPARRAEPNDGHRALVELERRGVLDTIITQNIDGLHHAAGSDPERIVEVHGNLREVVCMSCGERAPMERALERVRAGEDDPPCRSCGGVLKSATISFGQNLVPDDLLRAEAAARRCDLLLAVGSTLAVYPVAGAVPLAKASGAAVVIVNGSPTEMDDIADCVVRGPIGRVLPALVGVSPGETPGNPPTT